MKAAICAENLSKLSYLGDSPAGGYWTLRESLVDAFTVSYRRLAALTRRGSNGAGKSTLEDGGRSGG